MTTLAENVIVVWADNYPPMLDKSMYTSGKSHMILYTRGKEHGRIILNSILNKPLVYGTIEVDGVTRTKTYEELSDQEKLQDDCDAPISHSTPAVPQNAYQALAIQQPQAEFSQLDSRLVVPSFLPGDDLIASLNKAMVMIQQVQGTQNHSFAGTRSESNATNTGMHKNRGNNAAIQTRFIRCYNCWGEGHIARQCTQPKRPRNSEWFNKKLMLVHAHESGQTDDFDAFDLDCDEAPGAKAVLMANLSNYDSDVISEVPITYTHQDIYVLGHCVQEMYYSKQPAFNPTLDIEITSDSNIISYDQYLKEIERYKERIKQFEDKQNVDLNDLEKYIDSQINDMIHNRNANYDAFEKEIEILKSNLIKNGKENESLTTAINVLKKETKAKKEKHIKEIVDLEKKKKALDNIVYKVAQRIKPTLYDGSVITEKHDVIYVDDSEEALILAEESRLKMLEKQNDPISKEKKVNICPINYAELNKLSKHFGKHFVPQKELFAEQAVWLPISNIISKQLIVQPTLAKTEVPHELPKVSLINKSFQKLKNHLAIFDKVVKVRTTTIGIT
ncbi:retrovirus-related pol polyprotein from transposon TNT 1-94 [Tanacetum coccineum]